MGLKAVAPSGGGSGTVTNVTATAPLVSSGGATPDISIAGVNGTPTDGQLLIGNGTGFTLATLTQGSNITITNAAGSITIAATGGSGLDQAAVLKLVSLRL